MNLPRALLAVLVLACLTTLGMGLLLAEGSPSPVPASAPVAPVAPVAPELVSAKEPAGEPSRQGRALAVLRAWDVRRAAAWARGDLTALRGLYTEGSGAGRRDVAMLRSWAGRGLRVRGMRMQVLAARVRVASGRRLVLVVTDRLASAVAVGRGVRSVLPRDAASTRIVSLRLVAGEWRTSSVRPSRPGRLPARQ